MFIFGYGSLMNTASRKNTLGEHVRAYPATLKKKFGYRKRFNVITSRNINEIALGVEKNKKKTTFVRGALFPVNKKQIKKLNFRERMYDKINVPHKHINTTLKLSKKTKIMMYRPKKIRNKFKKTERVFKRYKNIVNSGTMQLFGKKM
jgi:cation transport regulator ChaC